MIEKYNLVSYKLFGKTLYQRKRKITKEFSSNLSYDHLEGQPIGALFLAIYPYILVDGYELYQESKWESFAVDFIAYSLMESFFNRKIFVREFHDNSIVSFHFYNETDVNLVIITGDHEFDNLDKIDAAIKALCEFEMCNNKAGSNIKNQLKMLVNSFIGINNDPYKRFSKVCLSKATKMDEFYNINQFITNDMFSKKTETRIDFEKNKLNQLRLMLDRRKEKIDLEVEKDRFFLKRFMDLAKQILSSEIYSLGNHPDDPID